MSERNDLLDKVIQIIPTIRVDSNQTLEEINEQFVEILKAEIRYLAKRK